MFANVFARLLQPGGRGCTVTSLVTVCQGLAGGWAGRNMGTLLQARLPAADWPPARQRGGGRTAQNCSAVCTGNAISWKVRKHEQYEHWTHKT